MQAAQGREGGAGLLQRPAPLARDGAVGRAMGRAVGRAPLAGGPARGRARGPEGQLRGRGIVDLRGRGHGAGAAQGAAQGAVLAVHVQAQSAAVGGARARAQQQPQAHVEVALRALRGLAAGGRGARQRLHRVLVWNRNMEVSFGSAKEGREAAQKALSKHHKKGRQNERRR